MQAAFRGTLFRAVARGTLNLAFRLSSGGAADNSIGHGNVLAGLVDERGQFEYGPYLLCSFGL